MTPTWEIRQGDALVRLREMPAESVQCCVTSPPYFGLRDYGVEGQIGLESTPDEFVARLVDVFREVRRVLRADGTLWCNVGDSYAGNGGARTYGSADGLLGRGDAPGAPHQAPRGYKAKDLLGVPWSLAFALRADGWYLRSDIIWSKPNPMPESVTDRPTSAHEHVFLLAKSRAYFYDADAIREEHVVPEGERRQRTLTVGAVNAGNRGGLTVGAGNGRAYPDAGRNKRNVWEIATQPFSGWDLLGDRRIPVASDEAGDDTTRIPSPDCPVHAGHPAPAPKASGGGGANGSSSRTADIGAHPDQAQLDGLAPTVPHPATSSAGESSDSSDPACSLAATSHSTETRRTDRDLATTQPCTPSDETRGHTGSTSASPECAGPHASTPASSSELDGSSARPSARTADRTAHKPSCTCEYYRLERTDHFATFPPKLIEPCILAGCPVGGVVLDPFAGAGTTGLVALRRDRSFVGIELNPTYAEMARERIRSDAPLLNVPAEMAA